jgi:hypothetical protein
MGTCAGSPCPSAPATPARCTTSSPASRTTPTWWPPARRAAPSSPPPRQPQPEPQPGPDESVPGKDSPAPVPVRPPPSRPWPRPALAGLQHCHHPPQVPRRLPHRRGRRRRAALGHHHRSLPAPGPRPRQQPPCLPPPPACRRLPALPLPRSHAARLPRSLCRPASPSPAGASEARGEVHKRSEARRFDLVTEPLRAAPGGQGYDPRTPSAPRQVPLARDVRASLAPLAQDRRAGRFPARGAWRKIPAARSGPGTVLADLTWSARAQENGVFAEHADLPGPGGTTAPGHGPLIAAVPAPARPGTRPALSEGRGGRSLQGQAREGRSRRGLARSPLGPGDEPRGGLCQPLAADRPDAAGVTVSRLRLFCGAGTPQAKRPLILTATASRS